MSPTKEQTRLRTRERLTRQLAERRAAEQARRKRRMFTGIGIAVVALVVALVLSLVLSNGGSSEPKYRTYDGVRVSTASGKPTVTLGAVTVDTSTRTADVRAGHGQAAATADSTLTFQYQLYLASTGKLVQSSWPKALTSPASGLVKGFQQGVSGMRVGGRRTLIIPASLGYGAQAQQGIPANSNLVFVVDMEKIA